MSQLSKYKRLSKTEKRLFLKVYISMFLIRPVIFLFPFKWYVHWLGVKNKETATTLIKEHQEYILLVKDTLRRIMRYHLFKPKCLAEAIVAKRMLNRKEIPSTLYMGVAKDQNNKMIAHAWLRCGDTIVTGKKGMEKYTVVSKFS